MTPKPFTVFRGASPRYLLDAEKYFNGLTTITLNANYRSSAPILEVANALAADAPEGFTSVLREEVPTPGAIQPRSFTVSMNDNNRRWSPIGC